MPSSSSITPTRRAERPRARSPRARSAAAAKGPDDPKGAESAGDSQARSAAAAEDPGRLIGRRVSILYRLHGDPDHSMSEVAGVVQRVEGEGEESRLFIRKRDGTLVDVLQGSIIRLKKIAPR